MAKIKIEVFTAPGCTRCIKAKEVIEKLLPKYKNVKLQVKSILDESEKIMQLGVMTTPVILINDKLVFNKIPNEKEFEEELKKWLKK